jgi:regulator of protease activity HflC (stomatin/prohibitin superfamily)
MKKLVIAISIIILLLIIIPLFIRLKKVPAGYVGVKVNLYGSEKGVNAEEVTTGRHWVGINTEIYTFPTFTQNYSWTQNSVDGSEQDESISFQDKDGLPINGDFGVSYHIDPEKVSLVFQKYRKGVDEITDIYLRNMFRDSMNKLGSSYSVEQIYGSKKAELISTAEQIVREEVDDIGIVIEKFYLIGGLRLPPEVIKAINLKIQAVQVAQQRENEVKEAEAAAKKKVAEAEGRAKSILLEAKAQADANLLLAKSLTPELVAWKALDRWQGAIPMVVGGNGAIPFLNIPVAGLDNK